jgi:hypothetical protein
MGVDHNEKISIQLNKIFPRSIGRSIGYRKYFIFYPPIRVIEILQIFIWKKSSNIRP